MTDVLLEQIPMMVKSANIRMAMIITEPFSPSEEYFMALRRFPVTHWW
jgi:hypothetical protein